MMLSTNNGRDIIAPFSQDKVYREERPPPNQTETKSTLSMWRKKKKKGEKGSLGQTLYRRGT